LLTNFFWLWPSWVAQKFDAAAPSGKRVARARRKWRARGRTDLLTSRIIAAAGAPMDAMVAARFDGVARPVALLPQGAPAQAERAARRTYGR
jgi:hypothetical protein